MKETEKVACNRVSACEHNCPHKTPHNFIFGECNHAVCDDFGDYACCISDYKHGDKVRYIPNHANGDTKHSDCQNGVVSSVNDKFVFVKYDCLACTMFTGDEPYTAQATKRENLTYR